MKRSAEEGSLTLDASAQIEAEMFMATVHGAMLSAWAQNHPDMFDAILKPALRGFSLKAR